MATLFRNILFGFTGLTCIITFTSCDNNSSNGVIAAVDSVATIDTVAPPIRYDRNKMLEEAREYCRQNDFRSAQEKLDSAISDELFDEIRDEVLDQLKDQAEKILEEYAEGFEKADYEYAKEQASSEAYDKFVEKYPNSRRKKEIERLAIKAKIDEAFDNDETGELPESEKTRNLGGSISIVSISNNTSYTLTVSYSGPSVKEVVISPYSKGTLTLINGTYRILAMVSAPGVRSYAGSETLLSGEYSSSYYITTDFR